MNRRLQAKHGIKSKKSASRSELNSISHDDEDQDYETYELGEVTVVDYDNRDEQVRSRYRSKRIDNKPHPYLSKGYEEIMAENRRE